MSMLERDAALATLSAALDEVVQGEGRLVLVSGEAGIGKTTLVEHFIRQRRDGLRLLWGACDALFSRRPLGPLHDMAAELPAHLASLLATTTDRTVLFSATLTAFQAPPAIVVIEDLHWADEATLDLVRFLGRRITRTRALLVLTYRDDELGPRHPLRLLLGDLTDLTTSRRSPLRPLSRQAVQRLVRDRPLDVARLHQQTGGNPFFLTEVLAGAGSGLPTTVRDAVLARVARLSPPALAILNAAAVIGPRIEPWLLDRVTGTAAPAIEECLAGGVLLASGDLLAFRHELARQAIEETIAPPVRTDLHRRILAALQDWPLAHQAPARLAHHAAGAGDAAAVLRYAPAAARQAALAQAHRQAAELYALALRFADERPTPDRAALLELYARECDLTDQRPQAIAALREAAIIWRERGEVGRQGEKLAQLVPMLRALGQESEAEASSRAAIGVLQTLPPGRELALAYRMQAVLSLARRELEAAIDWGEQAITLAERCGDTDVEPMTRVIVGAARLLLDEEAGPVALVAHLATVLALGHERAIGNTYTYLGACLAELHQFQPAEHYLAAGIAYATARDLDVFVLHMLAWQALTALFLGRWEEAAATSGRVLERAGVSSINRLPALVALGRLRARQGEPSASALLDEALSLAQPTGNVQHLGLVFTARAEAAWLRDDRAGLHAELDASEPILRRTRHPWFAGELALWRARAGGETDASAWLAAPFAAQLAGDWRTAAAAWAVAGCPYEQARALAEGDHAAQHEALAIFDRLGARPAADAVRRALRAQGIRTPLRGPRSATRANQYGLTGRQLEILLLMASGLSNAEIAVRLSISPKTVEHHVGAVLAKLEVPSRRAAIDLAHQQLLPG